MIYQSHDTFQYHPSQWKSTYNQRAAQLLRVKMHRHATRGLRAHGLCLLWLQENPFEPQRLFRKLLEKLRNKSKRRFENECLTGSHQFSSPVLFSEPPDPIKGQLHEEVSPWLLQEDRHATKSISRPEIQLRLPPPRPRRPAAPSSGPPGSLTPFLLLALLCDLPPSLPPITRVCYPVPALSLGSPLQKGTISLPLGSAASARQGCITVCRFCSF